MNSVTQPPPETESHPAAEKSPLKRTVEPTISGVSTVGQVRTVGISLFWLFALSVYILAGTSMASFHGDEAMQITMSADYATAFLQGEPGMLAVHPPYMTDSPEQLRLINGSVNRYTIGLSWHLAGIGVDDLPAIWQWPLSYDKNVERGSLPSDALLNVARIPSAIFLALSAAVMFGIGWRLGGARLAYLASGLYALNPVILLNGRRAMQEGSFLCFGLLTILLAILISQKWDARDGEDRSRRHMLPLWAGFILAGGLTLASKHSGIVFVAGAMGWIAARRIPILYANEGKPDLPDADVGEGLKPSPTTRGLLRTIPYILISGVLIIVVFVALSPGLWSNPVARLGDLIDERGKLLDSQVIANGPTSLPERIGGIITQPFMTPVEHYEAAFWANAEPVQAQIREYMASPLSGIQFGVILGGILTLCTGLGIAVCLRECQWGLIVWLAVTVASLLVNPLPWQRYYLPLLPLVSVLAGIGLSSAIRFVQNRVQSKSPLVGSVNVPQTK